MFIFPLTTTCTIEDAATITVIIINNSGTCCTATDDTKCVVNGWSELDHWHHKI